MATTNTNTNTITVTGYTANIKKLSNGASSFAVSVGVKQSDGSYKNGFINCYAKQGIEIPERKRVTISGFSSFSFFTPKNSDKEIGSYQVIVNEINEPVSQNGNTITVTGFTANIKKLENGASTFAVSVGVKQSDGTYKNGFINCYAKQGIEIPEKTRVTVSGFSSFSFFTPKNSDKEVGSYQIIVTTLGTTAVADSTPTAEPTPEPEQPSVEANVIDDDDPFA